MATISASIALLSQTVRFEPVQKDLGCNTQNDVPVHLALTDGATTLELRVRRPGQPVVTRSVSLTREKFGGGIYELTLPPAAK